MSRRYVKKARWNSLDQITPEVVAVVSARDNVENAADAQKYFKRNYLEAIRQIVPNFYFSDEQAVSGMQVSFPDQLINSHILAVKNQQTVLPLSGLTYDTNLSSLNSPEGLASYFYKDKPPAQIDADDFERNILYPLGASFKQFSTSSQFVDYVSGTLLPKIPSIHAGHHATDDLAALTNNAFATDSSGTYKYLAENLGWVYFLNRTGPYFDTSTALPELLTNTLWKGRPLVLEDNLNVFEEHLWRNEGAWGLADKVTPPAYTSSLDMSAGTYTSGVQVLDRLQTLNSVVYSPEFLNSTDSKVEKAFTTFFTTSSPTSPGALITDTVEAGPLSRFLEAMSFSIADGVGEQAELNTLYDIGKCPQEFLQVLGELIGWQFLGADFDRWRVQLRNAVKIYKMKGTKRAIQYLIDTLFTAGVFNVTTSDIITELWESYIPDLLYYSLATKSSVFKDFTTYTPQLALSFGLSDYDPNSMHRNIQFLVDKILLDLVREYPKSFLIAGKPAPVPQLMLSGIPYVGAYTTKDVSTERLAEIEYALSVLLSLPQANWGAGVGESIAILQAQKDEIINTVGFTSLTTEFYSIPTAGGQPQPLTLEINPSFSFNYRGRVYPIPPYEKRQYYADVQVTPNMIERIEYLLKCYGVDKTFAESVTNYIVTNTYQSLDIKKVINNFIIYTPEKTYPPNYSEILRDATKERTPDPVTLLSMWNGKSSHFLMSFDASSFSWQSLQRNSTSKYAINQVLQAVDQVTPAHAIPEVILTVSTVVDGMDALADNTCREWRPNFTDLYEGSSTVTTGFGVCAVDMLALATANGLPQHRFKRTQVDNINDVLLSGTTYASVPRNTLRRRNYRNLLPETKMFTRLGRNNPGSLELSSAYYSSAIGYMPLGYIPSDLAFQQVALRQNDYQYGIGKLIDYANLNEVWDICMNLTSPSSAFGYDVSNTFASRAKQAVESSSCNTYGRRGDLQEILYVMNKVHDQEKYLQASSIVSGYFEDVTQGRIPTITSSNLLIPSNFSDWYAQSQVYGGMDVPRSIGNYLINKEASDESLSYYEHFTFGRPVQELYNTYLSDYGGHGTAGLYDLRGGPNLFSHTYGPLIYNSNLDTDGSALEVSGYLAASGPNYEVNLAYYGGSGLLSVSGMNGKGAYDVGTSAASAAADLPVGSPEFRNKYLLSSIEITDTSTAYTFSQHPTFSIYRFSRDNQSRYSYAKYLIDNQVLKYHRSTQSDSFPRLRINIDNSDLTNLSRNFLEPDHEYEVTIKAHNLDSFSTNLGGQALGLWVHTQPELEYDLDGEKLMVWSYIPDGIYDDCNKKADSWRPFSVKDVSGPAGIYIATNNSQTRNFATGTLTSVLGFGEGNTNANRSLIEENPAPQAMCKEPVVLEQTLVGSDPQSIANISKDTLNELKFKFSTYNNHTIKLTDYYKTNVGPKLHRLNQKYTLELFTVVGHLSKFVVIENIEIKDITNYNKAVIRTKYGDAQLDLSDLKAVFRFLKGLSSGLASRNQTITSGTMEVSGGSRLNYRSNSSMYPNTTEATYNQLTDVQIYEG